MATRINITKTNPEFIKRVKAARVESKKRHEELFAKISIETLNKLKAMKKVISQR